MNETGTVEVSAEEFLDKASDTSRMSVNELKELLGKYVDAFAQAQKDVEDAENALKIREGILRTLQEETIPEIMEQAGITTIVLNDGQTISVKEEVFAHIPKNEEGQQECYKWLADNGLSDIIKNAVTIVESETTKITPELLDRLTAMGVYYERSPTVSPQTLKAAFRELLGMKPGTICTLDVDKVPRAFGLYRVSRADIKRK